VTLLAVVATTQERDALLRSVDAEPVQVGPYRAARTSGATVLVGGIGPGAAAAATGTALALSPYALVGSFGICGGFRGAADVGDVVVATDVVVADLGADSPEGFLAMGALGWADDTSPVDAAILQRLVGLLGEVVTGPVLTVSTVTGTDARAGELAQRHGAVAEAMEGWGVVEAARMHAVPVAEVRTVSNLVGVRDIATWDFPAAFASLARVGAALLEQPW
jgi:futalosine hydrolase